MGTAYIPFTIGEQDFTIEVEYRITHRWVPRSYDDPLEPPEWDSDPPKLFRDWKVDDLTEAANRRNTPLENPQWLQELFDEDGWLDSQVFEHVMEDEPDEPEYERED